MDEELQRRLGAIGAVLIEGPRASGKTETARQHASSEVLLDVDGEAMRAATIDPRLILDGDPPRLIDEWQLVPQVWNAVRRAVDERQAPGQFILTGSAMPADDVTRHSGAGRFARIRMRPMSLVELGRSSGDVSLRGLLAGQGARASDPGLTIPDLADLIAVGGWPTSLGLDVDAAVRAVRDYLNEIRRSDVARVAGPRRDIDRVARLIQSLARNVGTAVADSVLAAEAGTADAPLDQRTVAQYVDALTSLMIVEDQPAWSPHLRSRSRLRVRPKRHFVDPSLAVAALRSSPAALLRDLNYMGFLFESLVIRDLRIYAQGLDGDVYHYLDNNGLEVDAIVETPDGWAAFEVKLGANQVDAAAASLRRFAEKIDTSKSGEPGALGVIVGSGYGYVRPDGIAVIPIGALGP